MDIHEKKRIALSIALGYDVDASSVDEVAHRNKIEWLTAVFSHGLGPVEVNEIAEVWATTRRRVAKWGDVVLPNLIAALREVIKAYGGAPTRSGIGQRHYKKTKAILAAGGSAGATLDLANELDARPLVTLASGGLSADLLLAVAAYFRNRLSKKLCGIEDGDPSCCKFYLKRGASVPRCRGNAFVVRVGDKPLKSAPTLTASTPRSETAAATPKPATIPQAFAPPVIPTAPVPPQDVASKIVKALTIISKGETITIEIEGVKVTMQK